mmetsp:Transcript_9607/g.26932  ORF Transcript_9607/g.26932 Transcript_9607/m.26932 type:complete len:223 (+) Transcript_9607:336-1004(+)
MSAAAISKWPHATASSNGVHPYNAAWCTSAPLPRRRLVPSILPTRHVRCNGVRADWALNLRFGLAPASSASDMAFLSSLRIARSREMSCTIVAAAFSRTPVRSPAFSPSGDSEMAPRGSDDTGDPVETTSGCVLFERLVSGETGIVGTGATSDVWDDDLRRPRIGIPKRELRVGEAVLPTAGALDGEGGRLRIILAFDFGGRPLGRDGDVPTGGELASFSAQ